MFINNSETIFGDDIHFLLHEGDSFGRSHGDRMLSEKVIVEMLKNYPKKFEIKASCLGLLKSKKKFISLICKIHTQKISLKGGYYDELPITRN